MALGETIGYSPYAERVFLLHAGTGARVEDHCSRAAPPGHFHALSPPRPPAELFHSFPPHPCDPPPSPLPPLQLCEVVDANIKPSPCPPLSSITPLPAH